MSKRHHFSFLGMAIMLLAALGMGCDDATEEAACDTLLASDDSYALCEITDEDPAIDAITNADLQVQGDDEEALFELPWDFTFYGTDYMDVGVSTNGFVSMGDTDSSYDEPLPDFGTPLAVAWNDDLDSDSYGEGAQVQVFTDPNRVVYDWDTESHDDAGSYIFNHFQIVLYETGEILFHFIDFDDDVNCDDAGSGISVGDDTDYISLTDAVGGNGVCDLEGRSFEFMPL